MQIVIAGGNSYIGRHLTRELLDAGHRFTWLSHQPGKAEELGFEPDEILDVIFEYHDETGSWADEVGNADAIVNLSGHPIITRWNATVKHLIRESPLDTTRAMVDAISHRSKRATPSGPGSQGPRERIGGRHLWRSRDMVLTRTRLQASTGSPNSQSIGRLRHTRPRNSVSAVSDDPNGHRPWRPGLPAQVRSADEALRGRSRRTGQPVVLVGPRGRYPRHLPHAIENDRSPVR